MLESTEGSQLMPTSAGRCQDENVKITFKLLQWRRGKAVLREPGGLATSLVFLLATLSLKKLRAFLVSFTQANIHSLDKHLSITGHISPCARCLGYRLRAVVPPLELTVYGTPVDVHQVTFSRNYFKW